MNRSITLFLILMSNLAYGIEIESLNSFALKNGYKTNFNSKATYYEATKILKPPRDAIHLQAFFGKGKEITQIRFVGSNCPFSESMWSKVFQKYKSDIQEFYKTILKEDLPEAVSDSFTKNDLKKVEVSAKPSLQVKKIRTYRYNDGYCDELGPTLHGIQLDFFLATNLVK